MSIKLGINVRDKVTGFTGITISRIEYLNGCVQFCVKPSVDKDGKMIDGEYIDVHQLEIIDGKIDIGSAPTGGTMSDAPSERYTND